MSVLENIKQYLKDDADLNVVSEILNDLNPLKNVKTKEDALNFIDRNEVFKQALKSQVDRRFDIGLQTWKENHLPSLINDEREKIIKELNPEETEDQKRLRAAEQKLKEFESKEKRVELENKLMGKAKEIGFDPVFARSFSMFGDEAESKLNSFNEYVQNYSKSKMNEQLKGVYSNQTPTAGGNAPTQDINTKIADAKKSGDLRTASQLFFQKAQEQFQNKN